MADSEFSVFLAGDTLLVDPWSSNADPAFLALIEASRSADVSIANLETIIHEFKGYPQADSGGTYMASPPDIAAELHWAGFDLLSHANNHVFDYGPGGVLETHEHVLSAGLEIAGSGNDLQRARTPGYVCRNDVRVGMVAMSASFMPYWKASNSRPDFAGRPGLNPLSLSRRKRAIVLPPAIAERVRAAARRVGRNPQKLNERVFKIGLYFHEGRRFRLARDYALLRQERQVNLNSITEASGRADWVVASVHAHNQGPWLRDFAKDAIDAGAHCVFVHGPHEVRGIEFYNDCPIFYSLGDFVFEPEKVTRFPAEAYEQAGLDTNASPNDLIELNQKGEGWATNRRDAFKGVAVQLNVRQGRVAQMHLIPVDLQYDAPESVRGCPKVAEPAPGREIIEQIRERSSRYGTRIQYDPESNRGVVTVPE